MAEGERRTTKNIASCPINLPENVLQCYAHDYLQLPKTSVFFPQYYRFYLSIAADLETLGAQGDVFSQLIELTIQKKLIEGELSDLQRLEALPYIDLYKCRHSDHTHPNGKSTAGNQTDLISRVFSFISDSSRFAIPDKKQAYELTHIIFYLTHYGTKSIHSDDGIPQCFINIVGIWPFFTKILGQSTKKRECS